MTFDTGFSKSIFQSTTFWAAALGAVSMLIPTIAGKLGVTSADVPTIAAHIVQGISFIGVVYGRFTATQTVTLTGSTPTSPSVVSK